MIRKAVFPAAGFGTRFLPATKSSPKEMLPIVDIPIIDLAVREAKAAGIEEIIIVTSRGKGSIENYFDKSYELERELIKRGKDHLAEIVKGIYKDIEVVYLRQRDMKGLGDAVLTAKNVVGDEPFAVMLADDVIFSKTPCLKQMIEVFEEKHSSVVASMEVDNISSYGAIDPESINGKVIKIKGTVEKPQKEKAPSDFAIIGRYIFTPRIFGLLEKTKQDRKGEIQLTDAISQLLKEEDIYGYLFEGTRFDAGNKLEFLKATVFSALQRDDMKEDFKQYLKTILQNDL